MTQHDGHAPDQPIEGDQATQGVDPDLSRDESTPSPEFPDRESAAGASEQSRSQTGNEYEDPGVNYPDRRDGDDPPGHAPTVREASTTELQEPSTEKDPDEVPVAPAAPEGEPSHHAVGVGLIDDDASISEAGAQVEPAVRSHGDASQADSSGPVATATDAPQASAGSATQDAPAMDQHETSVDDKIAGIVVQTQADIDSEGVTDVEGVLAQRLADAGITVGPERLEELVHSISRR